MNKPREWWAVFLFNRRSFGEYLSEKESWYGHFANFGQVIYLSLQTLSFSRLVLFALGQMGWSLTGFATANLLVYFYLPPDSASHAVFPVYISQAAVWGFLTLVGLINFSGRIFDAITDPIIAGLSDKSTASFGRRRIFMAIGLLPFVICSVLVFHPPVAGEHPLNALWLGGCLWFFYLFMTVYVVPYNALIAELGHTARERVNITTAVSIAWAMSYGVGSQTYVLQSFLEKYTSPVQAFQWIIMGFAGMGAVLMMVPIWAIDEKRFARFEPSKEKIVDSFLSVWRNANFRLFLFADLTYWLATTFITSGANYYVTILMQLDKRYSSLMMMMMFVLSFVCYLPVNILSKKVSKKKLIMVSYAIFIVLFLLLFFLVYIPIPPMIMLCIMGVFAGFPVAAFGILPSALVADTANIDAQKTGIFKPGIYFASRTLMLKTGISLANIIFPSLLLMGKSVANPLGIRMSCLMAALFCLVGFTLFSFYEEETPPTE